MDHTAATSAFSFAPVVKILAERGLWGRPLHVVVGNPMLTACVSPFTRDLKKPLQAYGAGHAHALAAGVQEALASPTEESLYATALHFLQQDPALHTEKEEADRSVGITQHTLEGGSCTVIDMRRTARKHADARLVSSGWIGTEAVYVSVLASKGMFQWVEECFSTCGPFLHGFHALFPVFMPQYAEGVLASIPMALPATHNALCVWPKMSQLFNRTLKPSLHGPVLSQEGCNETHLEEASKKYGCIGYDPSGDILETTRIAACAAWARTLHPHTHTSSVGVNIHPPHCYPVLKAQVAHALACLNAR